MEILARIIRPSFLHTQHQHLGLGRRGAGGVERRRDRWGRWVDWRGGAGGAGEGKGVEKEEQDAP